MSAIVTGPAKYQAPPKLRPTTECASIALAGVLRGGPTRKQHLVILLIALAQIVGLEVFGAATLEVNDRILRRHKG